MTSFADVVKAIERSRQISTVDGFDIGFELGFEQAWTNPLFNSMEKISTPNKITVDGQPEMIVDGPEIKVDVYTNLFEKVLRQVEKL